MTTDSLWLIAHHSAHHTEWLSARVMGTMIFSCLLFRHVFWRYAKRFSIPSWMRWVPYAIFSIVFIGNACIFIHCLQGKQERENYKMLSQCLVSCRVQGTHADILSEQPDFKESRDILTGNKDVTLDHASAGQSANDDTLTFHETVSPHEVITLNAKTAFETMFFSKTMTHILPHHS